MSPSESPQVLAHSSAAPNRPVPFLKAATFGFYAKRGYFASEAARTEVRRMREAGVRQVCLVPRQMLMSYTAPRVVADYAFTPSDDELRGIIGYIREQGMDAILRPMTESFDGGPRRLISFMPDRNGTHSIVPGQGTRYWAEFFESLAARSIHYGKLAQETGCVMFGLDSELDGTVREDQHWKNVIAAARSVYSGPIDACFTTHLDFIKELERPTHWWRDLDSLSCSAYFPVAKKPGESVEELLIGFTDVKKWATTVAQRLGRPFLFGECGCISSTGAAMAPWAWQTGGYAPEEQANYLEAICRTFWDESWWHGLIWWKWDEHFDRPQFKNDPRGDQGFTVYGKPAAQVMQRWFSRTDR